MGKSAAFKGYSNPNPVFNVASVQQLKTPKQTITVTGTTATINFNNGSYIILDLTGATGDVTLTLQNPNTGNYVIDVLQGATARNVTFPAGTTSELGGGNTYTASGTNTKDKIGLFYDGSNYQFTTALDFS